jgi:cell division septum initiation protein DivIVA
MEKTAEFEGVDVNEVYFKLNSSEAIETKKEILEAVATILRMQIDSEKFKKLNQEFNKQRIEVKKEIDQLRHKMNDILEILPSMKIVEKLEEVAGKKEGKNEIKIEEKKKENKKTEKDIEVKKEVKKPKTLKDELDDIQKRLEGLYEYWISFLNIFLLESIMI